MGGNGVQSWLLLLNKVPSEPTSRRVYVWRKLKRPDADLAALSPMSCRKRTWSPPHRGWMRFAAASGSSALTTSSNSVTIAVRVKATTSIGSSGAPLYVHVIRAAAGYSFT